MKVYLARPQPDPGFTILMTIYEPVEVKNDLGGIDWDFYKQPVRMTPDALTNLGVDPKELPEPGKCVLVSLGEPQRRTTLDKE